MLVTSDKYAGWAEPTGSTVAEPLKPKYGTRAEIFYFADQPGSRGGWAIAYWVFPLGRYKWLQKMCSWTVRDILNPGLPPIGFWNRLKYRLDDNILFPCSACEKQHVHYSGGECPCGEPFPHKYKKVTCRS